MRHRKKKTRNSKGSSKKHDKHTHTKENFFLFIFVSYFICLFFLLFPLVFRSSVLQSAARFAGIKSLFCFRKSFVVHNNERHSSHLSASLIGWASKFWQTIIGKMWTTKRFTYCLDHQRPHFNKRNAHTHFLFYSENESEWKTKKKRRKTKKKYIYFLSWIKSLHISFYHSWFKHFTFSRFLCHLFRSLPILFIVRMFQSPLQLFFSLLASLFLSLFFFSPNYDAPPLFCNEKLFLSLLFLSRSFSNLSSYKAKS